MKPTANQLEAETLLREFGDLSALRLIERIKQLQCEIHQLREEIVALRKTNGAGKDGEVR